jgi:predicted membrane-bound mannosyltransferase
MDTKEHELNEAENQTPKTKDFLWLLNCSLVTAIAAFLRFFWLELKPLHHDEGVNGYFLTNLFRDGVYKYDPANYHGPDLYYISLAFSKIFGLNTLSVRSSVAIFGVLTVILAFCLRKYIGKTGSLFAALFIAISPGMTYISRYFIHEILFIFFSFGIAISMIYFIEKRKAGIWAIAWTALLLLICFLPSTLNLANQIGDKNVNSVWILRGVFFALEAVLVFFVMRMLMNWNAGQPIYLLLASANIVLLFATKETGFITVGTMIIACFCVWLWRKINSSEGFEKSKFWIFAVPTVLVILAVLIYYQRFYGFYEWLANEFLPLNETSQTLVFYAILALAFVAFLTWLVILFAVRQKTVDESEIVEPVELTWSNLREKLKVSDNWEFLLVKCGIGSVVIFLTWFFARILVELLLKWKGSKGISAGWNNIVFGKVDFLILAIGFVLLAVTLAVWKIRKPNISTDFVLMGVAATFTFLYVGALFFSSFFTYAEGLQGAFEAYAIWTKTGNTDHTQNGYFAYLKWGMKIEAPLLILSSLGLLIALVKVRHRFAIFAGLWAFGLFAAYTIIPYKTPWLALSFLLPMCVVAGYAINELMKSRKAELKILGGISAVLATGILAFQSYDINFVRYDNDAMPYIYAHTKRGFLDLIKHIEYYADKSGKDKEAQIEIVSPDYWSMPWYLNDYEKANFHGKIVDANTAEMIVAKKEEQEEEIAEKYAAHYKYAGEFPLRPGVDLILLVRKDLADSDAQDIYQTFGHPITMDESQPITPNQ